MCCSVTLRCFHIPETKQRLPTAYTQRTPPVNIAHSYIRHWSHVSVRRVCWKTRSLTLNFWGTLYDYLPTLPTAWRFPYAGDSFSSNALELAAAEVTFFCLFFSLHHILISWFRLFHVDQPLSGCRSTLTFSPALIIPMVGYRPPTGKATSLRPTSFPFLVKNTCSNTRGQQRD